MENLSQMLVESPRKWTHTRAAHKNFPTLYCFWKVLAIPGDLEKDEDIKALIDKTIKHFGRLDILVSRYPYIHYIELALLLSYFSQV